MKNACKIIGGLIGLGAIATAAYIAGNVKGHEEERAEREECELGRSCPNEDCYDKIYDDKFGTVKPFNEDESRLVSRYNADIRELVEASEELCSAVEIMVTDKCEFYEAIHDRACGARAVINRIKSTNYIYNSSEAESSEA